MQNMTNHQLAERYIAKYKLLGQEPLMKLEFLDNDRVIITGVTDDTITEIAIPQFVTDFFYQQDELFGDVSWCYGLKLRKIVYNNSNNSRVLSDLQGFACGVDSEELEVYVENTSGILYFNGIFQECKAEKITGLENWDLSSAEEIKKAFYRCRLTNLSILEDWDVSNVTDMEELFARANNLKSLKSIRYWKVGKVRNMQDTFKSCVALKDLNGLEN